MEGFIVFAMISMVIFDFCCIKFLRKSFMSSIEHLINTIMKELAV